MLSISCYYYQLCVRKTEQLGRSKKKRDEVDKTVAKRKISIQQIVFLLILAIFIAFSIFISLRLKAGIAPDESGHFLFSKLFSVTWGIPKDSAESISTGWVIKGRPFVYYWVNGRMINIINLLHPSITDSQLLTVLRLTNVFYSTTAMILLYLTSKELIKNRWLQILPVFLLANTLMWVFLSGAVNYDNMANMFCFAAVLFFVRAYKWDDFQKNSLLWISMIALGCLVKYTILPFAVLMALMWLFTGKLKQQFAGFKNAWNVKTGILTLVAGILTLSVIILYGSNLINYRSLTPVCMDALDSGTCALDPMAARYHEQALPEKLSILESIRQGYPNPLEYIFYSWIPKMLVRIHGILGHLIYYPSHIIIVFYLLYVWYSMLGFKYFENSKVLSRGLALLLLLYAGILLLMNYNSELVYGFKNIAMQGRYIFPVIGIATILMTRILEFVKSKTVLWLTVSMTILLFFVSGPIKFLVHSQTIFIDWFI